MRFYFNKDAEDPLVRLVINMANAQFYYGYEYLGVPDRLGQTPLTDRCYLTLTRALEGRLGGSPFGPIWMFNLVGLCWYFVVMKISTFDFQAMGRIFVSLCQVGAWGCFD